VHAEPCIVSESASDAGPSCPSLTSAAYLVVRTSRLRDHVVYFALWPLSQTVPIVLCSRVVWIILFPRDLSTFETRL